ncbi:unnamed protein product [Cladocopium goreaui]|uniref:Peptidylprolyl isomerase n=1 Tax=Cladocopium goreaui TaxID=2562237 RepID=A0A9P1DBX2_9DINO|nr:unnamed protein product [Cladocopium goreaui]
MTELEGDEPLVTCCRCEDGDGLRVTKLPEWNQVEDDDEEEINFGSLTSCSDRPRRPAVESWSSLGRLRPEDLDFSELTPEAGALRISNVDRRGINFDQLKKLLVYVKKRCDSEDAVRGWYDHRSGEQLFYKKMTLSQVHHWLIHPLSLRHQCSYVEAVAKKEHAQLPAWFVGHSWDEPMVNFVRRVMKHGTLGAGDGFWCHPFASRPNPGGWYCHEMSGSQDLSVEPFGELSHLRANLKNCRSNSIDEWLSFGVPALAELKSLDLTVSDSPKLMTAGHFSKKSALLQDLHMTFRCPLRSADAFCRSLQHLSLLQVLHIDMSGCAELQHLGGSASNGSCFPNMVSLHTLQLDLTNCRSLSSLHVLSDDMQAMRIFHLRLSQCTSLASLEDLVRPLEHLTLTDFELNMSGCRSLQTLGELSTQLRSHLSLERLRLNFCDCDSIPKEVEMDLATCLKEISHGRDVCAVPFQTEEGKISL